MKPMDKQHRDLILASEIGGFLHDLGKLLPDFALENFAGGDNNLREKAIEQAKINAAHGAILESGRLYPSAVELAENALWPQLLDRLLNDCFWKKKLNIPVDWCHVEPIQATGLGAPLRQHHAVKDCPNMSLLGDIYSFGADIRDSALDKSSGGCLAGITEQYENHARISDALGLHSSPYKIDTLARNWQQAADIIYKALGEPGQEPDVLKTRHLLYKELGQLYKTALGETRRPTNDVTLYHHSFSAASHFKAAMAEGVLRQGFKLWQDENGGFKFNQLGLIRFRLLGIRWHWSELSRGVLRPVALASLSQTRHQAENKLRQLFEETYPVGNIIYSDDDGVLVLVPGFYEGLGEENAISSEALFSTHILDALMDNISQCLNVFGCGTAFHLYWSEPSLYLTEYAKALGINPDPARQRFGQVGMSDLKALWNSAPKRSNGAQVQICPQCGLRPAGTREMAVDESALGEQDLCKVCTDFSSELAFKERRINSEELFGIRPNTFNLQEISKKRGDSENGQMVLISVQVDNASIASGEALITQLARPVNTLKANKREWSANRLGDEFNSLLSALRANDEKAIKQLDKDFIEQIGSWIGDHFWLGKKDGRSLQRDKLSKALEIAESFFLHEAIPKGLGLCRHDGDRLALFAQRKHASPARLQRLWDDLEDLWRELISEAGHSVDFNLMPLSLDARGVRFMVSANDASGILLMVQRLLQGHLSKVRGGLAVHVSALAMRAKFPLYIAMDAIYRMEQRVAKKPRQLWEVKTCRHDEKQHRVVIDWQTPQGDISWSVDTDSGDPAQEDIWHPHVICVSRPEGPDRLLHVRQLKAGDQVSVPVSTFDFLTMEGSARRFDIHYDEQCRRPHLIFGRLGRMPHLLEQLPELVDPKENWVAKTGWDSSRLKGLFGRMVETYENWVRLAVNDEQRQSGLVAWKTHLRDLLSRYVQGQENEHLRYELLAAIEDGRFFDAVEWNAYICKSTSTKSKTAEISDQD